MTLLFDPKLSGDSREMYIATLRSWRELEKSMSTIRGSPTEFEQINALLWLEIHGKKRQVPIARLSARMSALYGKVLRREIRNVIDA
jgi:hypothetical protein